jgi:hypothetical protein
VFANVGYGVAGVALVGGVALWFLGKPDDEHPRRVTLVPRFDSSAASLGLVGEF